MSAEMVRGNEEERVEKGRKTIGNKGKTKKREVDNPMQSWSIKTPESHPKR
jgi:hypothetical protein